MTVDPEIDLEWARIPHFYNAFYVYKYATGLSAAIALARGIMEHGHPALVRYLDFLKRGNSGYPLDLLRLAGVDMARPEPVNQALERFGQLLEEMERSL
jgi:oligoendopeptidase F